MVITLKGLVQHRAAVTKYKVGVEEVANTGKPHSVTDTESPCFLHNKEWKCRIQGSIILYVIF